jgi:hypothetical protein
LVQQRQDALVDDTLDADQALLDLVGSKLSVCLPSFGAIPFELLKHLSGSL